MRYSLFILGLAAALSVEAQEVRDTVADTVVVAPRPVVKTYRVVSRPTPNVGRGRNTVEGIVLHHTAEPSAQRAMQHKLCNPKEKVSSHIVVDYDGTRYILAPPTAITYHAGKSRLAGRDGCNAFTVGIEIQGNTLEAPLTDDQVNSVVEYIVPLIRRYHIPLSRVVTHEMVRNNWLEAHPEEHAYGKVDITRTEYQRIMKALRKKLRR